MVQAAPQELHVETPSTTMPGELDLRAFALYKKGTNFVD
jgi:hypothetical protein